MRRNRKGKKYKSLIFFLSAFCLIGFCLYYIYFVKPLNISCGIILDKKDYNNKVSLKIYFNNDTKWISISKTLYDPSAIAYNINLKGKRVLSAKPSRIYTGKVLMRNNTIIELEDEKLKLNPNVLFYHILDKKIKTLPANSVIVGYSTYKFITDEKGNVGAVYVDIPEIKKLRIGISNSDFSSLDHKNIIFSSKKGLNISTEKGDYKIKKDECLKADFINDSILLSIYKINKNNLEKSAELGFFKKRIYITSSLNEPISVPTLKRLNGYIPVYYGNFELFTTNSSIRVVNEVDLEDYLRFVVPSEMPLYAGLEGHKVQAIAARTYALSDTLSGRFAKYGFNLDDTVLSQAYNSQPSNIICDKAIEETKGKILTYNKKIIDAKYFSTSCGVGAAFNEVWFNSYKDFKNNKEPYLTFNDFTGNGIKDLSNEEDAINFFKDWTIKAYDSNSPYFRWKIDIDKETLNKAINENIYNLSSKYPNFFEKKWIFNIYKKTDIPKTGIGDIKDIYINRRGKSGIIMELTIVTDTGEYRIIKESIIRNLITPKNNDIEIIPLYGDKIKNAAKIPSGFFIIDKQYINNKLKSITLYGGGFGHGCGMSQYGVIGLVRNGKKYDEILNIFYKNVNITDYNTIIKEAF